MEAKNAWQNIHADYSKQDWINKPSIFAEQAVPYLPQNGALLEIGGGLGQDSIFFAEKGHDVTFTDHSADALSRANMKIKEAGLSASIKTQVVDATQTLPFEDSSFDVVYAHLSLHYFDSETTAKIFSEIRRILKEGGIVAAFFNSTSDPEFGTGKKLEEGYFLIRDMKKRFFSVESLKKFVNDFEPIILDDKGETYKDGAKGIHNLIRFIGRKA